MCLRYMIIRHEGLKLHSPSTISKQILTFGVLAKIGFPDKNPQNDHPSHRNKGHKSQQ